MRSFSPTGFKNRLIPGNASCIIMPETPSRLEITRPFIGPTDLTRGVSLFRPTAQYSPEKRNFKQRKQGNPPSLARRASFIDPVNAD
jgi:hypothetical protein